MKKLLLVLFLFSIITAEAQVIEKKNVVKFTPSYLLDPFNPALEFSYERFITKNFSIQPSVGATLPFEIMNIYYSSPAGLGFRLKGEIRGYIPEFKKIAGLYLAANVYYLFRNTNDTFEFEDFNGSTYEDNIIVIKNIYGSSFRVGMQGAIKNRFVIDAYVGLGLRYRVVTHLSRQNRIHDFHYHFEEINIYKTLNEIQYKLYPAFHANVNIGYKF